MNLVPYLASATLLVFAAGMIAVTHVDTQPDGAFLEPGARLPLTIQLVACAVSFIAGWQL